MWWLTRKGVVDIGSGDPLEQRPVRQKHELTIEDLPYEVVEDFKRQLQDEFYANFDFMSLYRVEEEGGFSKMLPWISTGMLVVILLLSFR